MEPEIHEQLFPTLGNLFSTRLQSRSESTKHLYDEKFVEKQLEAEEYFKSQKKTSKSADLWVDSDEEFKAELEKAVTQHKKNMKSKKPVGMDSDLYNKRGKSIEEKSQILNSFDNSNNDFRKEQRKNGNDVTDMLNLINYFFLQKTDKNERPTNKSYSEYEKQGAIPKWKVAGGKHDRNNPKTENFLDKKKSKIKNNQWEVQNGFPSESQQGIKEDTIDYIFFKKFNSDDLIVKVSEECCSEPFFYIVPENPSPNFFLSRGSYYVIPKTPSSTNDNRIIFHPVNEAVCDLNVSALSPKTKFSGILPNKHKLKQYDPVDTNNLGKEVLQKMDSHLNIGPADVKLSESDNNLETNYDLNKNFEKSLLNSSTPNQFNICRKERQEVESDLLVKTEKSTSNSGKEIPSNLEGIILQQQDKALQILLSEIPNLDEDSAKNIADKYLLDEDGLKNFIASAHLKQKIDHQLERMALALPENNWDELRNKCYEFQGNEELVKNYILQTQKANRIQQQILDMQFVFPDADPDFLRQEIEKLEGNDSEFNNLIDKLLDNKNYPKISEDFLSAERKKWWRMYVEKFNVKNFILEIPEPGNFAGPAGDNNKMDEKLIVKFLQSRYPSKTPNFLVQAFVSNNRNVTKTCDSLNESQLIRLSESSFRNEAFSEAFLKEICYIDHKKEVDEYLKDLKERKEIETEEARLNNSFLSCPLCSEEELIASEAICCLEGHLFCKDCIRRYIFVKISDGVFKFACPSERCDAFFSYEALQDILPENILANIFSKQQALEINGAKVDGLESCPYCEFAYIPNPEDKIFKCQNLECLIETCRLCHEKNHIPLRCEEVERPIDVEARIKIEESMTQKLVRICPTCGRKFVKIDGCNKMMCVCGTIMCYICRKKITGYDHFNSNGGKCSLYSNNVVLHGEEVFQAGIRTREEILRRNQSIRLLHDPTVRNN